jgi:3-hydroxymyristoyl/3-hydroxydecanoyl-(acyl carrier protein) dehydratase
MNDAYFETGFRIGADHPALPGHFPGQPVVPGVVLLDMVAAAIARWKGATITGMPQVKFVQALLPDENAELRVEDGNGGVRFHVSRAGAVIATGLVEIALAETTLVETTSDGT